MNNVGHVIDNCWIYSSLVPGNCLVLKYFCSRGNVSSKRVEEAFHRGRGCRGGFPALQEGTSTSTKSEKTAGEKPKEGKRRESERRGR